MNNEMKKLHGIVTAMVTPFDKRGNVDLNALRDLTDFLIERGVNCLYPCGTTGEMYLLSVDERKMIAETIVKQAAGRVTVYIHVGAMTTKDTVELAQHAHSVGADGIGVVTPSFFKVNDSEMEEYFVEVAGSVPGDFPVYLYNIPQCSGNDLRTETVSKIVVRCPNVIGIKYSYPDFLRVNEYLAVNGGNFSVVVGADRLLVAALTMGCDGTVSGVSCVCPEPYVAIYKSFKEGRTTDAKALQQAANEISELLKNGSNMAFFKDALRFRGVSAGRMRRPLLDLPDDESANLTQDLEVLLEKFNTIHRQCA